MKITPDKSFDGLKAGIRKRPVHAEPQPEKAEKFIICKNHAEI
jgi:hypothetical protein